MRSGITVIATDSSPSNLFSWLSVPRIHG